MALVLKDRVKETSTTTGTGTFTLAGAATGFQSFSVIGNSNTVYYTIVRNGYDEWEIGIGTYTSSGTTLSRDTVLESSNSGSKVNFSAGTKEVFCTYPAEKAVTIDDVQTLSNKTLASPSVTGSITFSDASTQSTAATGFGFKNRIINGAMMIDQRNAGASVTPATSAYTLDRWKAELSQSLKFSVQQSSTAPTGFSNSLLVTSTSAYSVLTGDYFLLRYNIEGFNTADLGFGTASAASITVSFWVRSSLTGTFGASIQNSATDRSYPFSYTINAANTWEQKTVTIAGDTTGTWIGATNGVGLRLEISLGVGATYSGTANAWASTNYFQPTGSTSVVGTSGATFYITGVQLEKGSTATSFDYRPYGTELQLCQRYYQYVIDARQNTNAAILASSFTSTKAIAIHRFLVTMRASPTLSSTAASGFATIGNGTATSTSSIALSNAGTEYVRIDATSTGMLQGGSCFIGANTGTTVPNISLSSEL